MRLSSPRTAGSRVPGSSHGFGQAPTDGYTEPSPRVRRTRHAPVAQRIEHLTTDQKVRGSNPFGRALLRQQQNTIRAGSYSPWEPALVVRSPPAVAGSRYSGSEPRQPEERTPMRIAVFATCLADAMFPKAAQATVVLLERVGHEVVFPPAQTCCGQMHINSGYQREALPLVRHHVDVFEDALTDGVDAIVAPSGSCVGSVRHQHADVARQQGDDRLARRATDVAGRTYELSELLVDFLGVTDVGARFPHRVTYHPTCHSLRVLRVGD